MTGPQRHVLIPDAQPGREVLLPPQQARHLVQVLRLEEGDTLIAFTPDGDEYLARIASIRKKEVRVLIEGRMAQQPRSGPIIRLCFSPPEPQRGDWLVEKATELGVAELRPVLFARTQGERAIQTEKRLERWRRIAQEAAQQCARGDLPRLFGPVRWGIKGTENRGTDSHSSSNGLSVPLFSPGLRLLAHLDDRSVPILQALLARPHAERADVTLVVGPEGGLIPQEIDAGIEAGLTLVSLGETILRTETAAIVGAGAVGMARRVER